MKNGSFVSFVSSLPADLCYNGVNTYVRFRLEYPRIELDRRGYATDDMVSARERFFLRILGIDPGIAIVGFGFVDKQGSRMVPVQYGSIQTESTTAP